MGPYGPVTAADLPTTKTTRWSIRRKATLVAAVEGGLLSVQDACSRYALTVEEFVAWQHCIDRYGLNGLRTTRIQYHFTRFDREPSAIRPRAGGSSTMRVAKFRSHR